MTETLLSHASGPLTSFLFVLHVTHIYHKHVALYPTLEPFVYCMRVSKLEGTKVTFR